MSGTQSSAMQHCALQARLEGRDEDDADEIALPPIPPEDVRDLALASSRSTVRECGVTHIRQGRPPILLSAFSTCSASVLCDAQQDESVHRPTCGMQAEIGMHACHAQAEAGAAFAWPGQRWPSVEAMQR